jgi:cell division initiation protein
MKETVKHYKTIEESLQHTLIIAQQTSESITNIATEKADDIIKKAEINALNIINNANKKVDSIHREYEDAKKSLNIYKIKSQALLNSTMELLKNPFEEKNE